MMEDEDDIPCCKGCDEVLSRPHKVGDCCECCGANFWCCVDECSNCNRCQQDCCDCNEEEDDDDT